MTKSRKRMLLSSIAMLLVALVALGSATYAWFTINKVVTADRINVKAVVGSGLVINNKQSPTATDWKRSVQFAEGNADLFPVSIDIKAVGATDDDAVMGTPIYAKDVNKDGQFRTENEKDTAANFEETTLPSSYVTGQDLMFKKSDYVAAYTVQIKSSGDAIDRTVTAAITCTASGTKDTTNSKDATNFVKAALVDASGKVIGFYSDAKYYAIVGTTTQGVTTYAASANQVADEVKTNIPALSSVKASTTTTPDAFTLYVWYEGNDEDCKDALQEAIATFTLTFTLGD